MNTENLAVGLVARELNRPIVEVKAKLNSTPELSFYLDELVDHVDCVLRHNNDTLNIDGEHIEHELLRGAIRELSDVYVMTLLE